MVGSSLVVYPAASLPDLARSNGARLVILNPEVTQQDRDADLALHSEIGVTMAAAVNAL